MTSGEGSSLTSKAEAMFITIVHGSQEKRTPPTKAWDNDGKYEWKDLPIELWDGESGETVEFFVNVERNGTRWRDSMTTMSMSDFRRRPEHRFTVRTPLGPIGSSNPSSSPKGFLVTIISYTEDCLQPTLFQSLFCTAFVNCGGAMDMLNFDFGGVFLPNLLSAQTRAQQRLLERDRHEAGAEVPAE